MPVASDPLSKNGHYLNNALRLALAAEAAYKGLDEDQIVASLGGMEHFTRATILEEAPAYGYVAGGPKNVAVVFRGTDDPSDWINNVRYLQIPGFGGHVHKGFAEQFFSLQDAMLAAVEEFRTGGQALWVAGHSLGGALATLATLRLVEAKHKPFATYTYGSPRVLDPLAAAVYRKRGPRTFRFVNHQDLVPHLPSVGSLLTRYEHVGDLEFLLQSGNLGDADYNWKRMAHRVARALFLGVADLGYAALADHALRQYIRKLEQVLG